MDIGIKRFAEYLPFILNDISTSCFVSLDFEFSGLAFPPNIPTKPPTVEERYLEAKEAASRYQILQVGLTICHENPKTATYTLKPFNFNLSPLTQPGIDVNRDWVFGSRSMEFLLNQGFSIDAMCSGGVRYLSREEESSARQRVTERARSATPTPGAKVQGEGLECLEFLKSSRLAIDTWLAQGEDREKWLNIPPPTTLSVPPSDIPSKLSNVQKRLVHELISLEYPDLASRGAAAFVQIVTRNPELERRSFEMKAKAKKERIRHSVGFRWIAEALVGGNLDELDPECFRPMLKGIKKSALMVQQLADGVKSRLKQHRPVLVGHNMFFDLLFFYRCFIGPLPDTLKEFNVVIHKLFPVLADTKYLATHDIDNLACDSSLEDLNRNLVHLENPKMEIDPRFTKYKYRKCAHEAGYDSMLTAMVFIKLAGNLQRCPDVFLPRSKRPPGTVSKGVLQQMDRPRSTKTCYNNLIDFETDNAANADDQHVEHTTTFVESGDRQITSLANRGMLVPRLGTIFWANYGNKLRVNGTQEKVIRVTDHPANVELLIEI